MKTILMPVLRNCRILFLAAVMSIAMLSNGDVLTSNAANYAGTNWMAFSKFGVMTHYLPHKYGANGNQSLWDNIIRGFDANWFADQVLNSGATYVLFPVGQYDPNWSAPNATYESLLGVQPGTYAPTTDDADIIKKLIPALNSRGIKLMLYFPLSGPRPSNGMSDISKLSFPQTLGANVDWNTGQITYTQAFIQNIASIVQEYSYRYGSGIAGWWFDDAWSIYGLDNTNRWWLDSVNNAAKAGNPNAVISFNRGVDTFKRFYEWDDYNAGEASNLNFRPNRRWVDGVQFHALTHLGTFWGQADTRFSNTDLANYVHQIASNYGTATLDVHVDQWGTISQPQKDQLNYIGDYMASNPIPNPPQGWDSPSRLSMNQYLKPGDYLVSYDSGTPHFALMQSDGNFAIYQGTGPEFIQGGAVWTTGTYHPSQPRYALMQPDGNFCVYPGTDPWNTLGASVWGSNHVQSGGNYFIQIQSDGNLVINRDYNYFWSWMYGAP